MNAVGTVPVASLICMGISCAVGFGIPICLFIYLRKKGADIFPFFVGCAVLLLFALALESVVHYVVLTSPYGTRITGNPVYYALYGGAMAAIFEEFGRLFAMKFILRKYIHKDINALMYGAGHGGFEAAFVLGLSMVSNIAWAVSINNGNIEKMTEGLTGEALTQTQGAISALITTPSYQFALGGIERLFAVAIQISLSVLVWFAVKKTGKMYLFLIALAAHFAVDTVSVLIANTGINLVLVEGAVAVMTAILSFFAYKIWRANAEV